MDFYSSPNPRCPTKLCVIIDSNTPIIMKVQLPATSITLKQFKEITSLDDNCYKFYFKSEDSEFGLVKEEVVDDMSKLPYDSDNKIVAWVISDKLNQSTLFENPDYDLPSQLSSPAKLTPSRPLPLPPQSNQTARSPAESTSAHDYEISSFRLNFRPGTHSLPRSITPRSLYAQNNFTSSLDTCDNNFYDQYTRHQSRSVYESTSPPSSLRQLDVVLHCTRDDIKTIYSALKKDSASLDIKDREWLRVVIKEAFLGSSLVKWLNRNVYGFNHKRQIKQFANQMLQSGLIRNPMSSGSFSEKCYYSLT